MIRYRSMASTVLLALGALSLVACGLPGSYEGPPPAPGTPDGAVAAVAKGMAEGDPRVVWDALPLSYRTHLEDVVHTFGDSVDPTLWNPAFDLVGRVGRLMHDKKDLFVTHPKLLAEPGSEKILAQWDGIGALLETVAESEFGDAFGLRTLDVRRFLGETGVPVAAYVTGIFQAQGPDAEMPDWSQVKAETLSEMGDTARVRIEGLEQGTLELDFVRVEGRWLPRKMVEQWPEAMARIRERLEMLRMSYDSASGAEARLLLSGLEGVVDRLETAETHDEIEEAFGRLMPLLFDLAPSAPSAPSAPALAPDTRAS